MLNITITFTWKIELAIYKKCNESLFVCSVWTGHKHFLAFIIHWSQKLDLQSAGSSPNLTYTKLGARDAIMIPWRGWIWTPPLDSDLDTSHKFPKVLGLMVEELRTPHWHLMVLGYSPSKTEGWFITFFLNLKYYPMFLLLLSTRSIILAGWIKRIILGTRLFSF